MEKSKTKKQQRVEKPPLNVSGQLAMPREILPWERELLTVLLEAFDDSSRRKKTENEVPS